MEETSSKARLSTLTLLVFSFKSVWKHTYRYTMMFSIFLKENVFTDYFLAFVFVLSQYDYMAIIQSGQKTLSNHQFFISSRWKILLGNMRHPVSSFNWVSWGEIKTQTAILQLVLGHIFFLSHTPPPTFDIPGGTAWTFSRYNMRMLCGIL